MKVITLDSYTTFEHNKFKGFDKCRSKILVMEYEKNRNRAHPAFRRNIKVKTTSHIAEILANYYDQAGIPNHSDIQIQAAEKAKEIDKQCWNEHGKNGESAYQQCVINKIDQYKHQLMAQEPASLDTNSMARIMITSLQDLKDFKEHTEFIGPHDLSLLEQLIRFVEEIQHTANNIQSSSNQPNLVQLYYTRLFLPIKETILKRNGKIGRQQPSNYQHSMASPVYSSHQPFPPYHSMVSPSSAHTPVMQSQVSTDRTPTPVVSQTHSPRANTPTNSDQPVKQRTQTPTDTIRLLFSEVRSDCAVFYATPHTPHF